VYSNSGCLDRIEAIMLIDFADLRGHLVDGANIAGRTIDEAAGKSGLELLWFLLLVVHFQGLPLSVTVAVS
jgi:hypothetical protein